MWTGKYTSAPADLTYDLTGKRWDGDPSDAGVGEGTFSLTINEKTGNVIGESSGALGEIVATGFVADGHLTLKLTRKNASDDGFMGTAVGTTSADKVEGEMRLSLARANVLRKASFTLSRKP